MKLLNVMVCAIMLTSACAVARAESAAKARSHAELSAMFEDANTWRLASDMYRTVDAMTQNERNDLALIAAERLTLGDLGKNLTAADWKPEFINRPENKPIGSRWWMNQRAAELLRYMCEQHYVSDAKVILHLIDALDHPDRWWVRRDALYALVALTHHHCGDRTISNYDKEKYLAEVNDWWRRWWRAKQNKHPIYDSELDTRIKAEGQKVVQRIANTVGRDFRVMKAFQVPDKAPGAANYNLLYDFWYEPRLYCTVWWGDGPRPDEDLWLDVSVEFGMHDLIVPGDWMEPYPKPDMVKLPIRTIYEKRLTGCDAVVRVRIAAKDEALVAAIRQTLTGSYVAQPRGYDYIIPRRNWPFLTSEPDRWQILNEVEGKFPLPFILR